MTVEILQLVNNYISDRMRDKREALGEYCTFGYFDALHIESASNDNMVDEEIWKKINETVSNLDGSCNRRNLICITNDDKKNKKFWELAKGYPFLFISMIRIDRQNMRSIYETIGRLNQKENIICYYPYEHSEVIILCVERSYSDGTDFILSLRNEFNILKMYSIFSVKEMILDNIDKILEEIVDEEVDIRLRALVKDNAKITDFCTKLYETLFDYDKSKEKLTREYDVFGNGDLLIEIESVPLSRLLSCYSMGNLLTHTNDQYNNCFFNVETEIVRRR